MAAPGNLQIDRFFSYRRTICVDESTSSRLLSVASNIAAGYGRTTKGEYVPFLGHARGSNCEVQTQLLIAKSLGFGSAAEL